MVNKNKNLIKNIYIMLAYAYKELDTKEFKKGEKEDFDNALDLFSFILSLEVSRLLKHGLFKEYVLKNEDMNKIKGKLDIHKTISLKVHKSKLINVNYDEFSSDVYLNQIIKTTINFLLKQNVKKEIKEELKKHLIKFYEVEAIAIKDIKWGNIKFKSINSNYRFIINICRMILESRIVVFDEEKFSFGTFLEKDMPMLFQRFIFQYYLREKKRLNLKEVRAKQFSWSSKDARELSFLGKLNTDITLNKNDDTVLIIDAKYYAKVLTNNRYKEIFNPANVFQIHTYVSEADWRRTGEYSGMLLYAKTENSEDINESFHINNGVNKITIRTLDLNKDFYGENGIKYCLDSFV